MGSFKDQTIISEEQSSQPSSLFIENDIATGEAATHSAPATRESKPANTMDYRQHNWSVISEGQRIPAIDTGYLKQKSVLFGGVLPERLLDRAFGLAGTQLMKLEGQLYSADGRCFIELTNLDGEVIAYESKGCPGRYVHPVMDSSIAVYLIGEWQIADYIYLAESATKAEAISKSLATTTTSYCVISVTGAGNFEKVFRAIKNERPDACIGFAADREPGASALASFSSHIWQLYDKLSVQGSAPAIYQPPVGFKDWDDALYELGYEKLLKAIEKPVIHAQKAKSLQPVIPEGFTIDRDLLYWVKPAENDDKEVKKIPLCSELRVTSNLKDSRGKGWCKKLEFNDVDGYPQQLLMPMELLAGDGIELRRQLLSHGLPTVSSNQQARKKLIDYLMEANPNTTTVYLERTGWHVKGDTCAYVLPDQAYGQGAESITLQSDEGDGAEFEVLGTGDNWREYVGAICTGNSRLVFAVSCAFAAPLLPLLNVEGGGFNMVGNSSIGKSKSLIVASSVCGRTRGTDTYWHTWRATGNGLEGICKRRNHSLLCLDELKQVDAKEAGQIAYMIAQGSAKARANRNGGLRTKESWQTLCLSTGELTLADHIAESGKQAYAGMETRILDIPADTGAYGTFENLHGSADGAEFAKRIEQATFKYHGAVLREYLTVISLDYQTTVELATSYVKQFVDILPERVSGQVSRAIERFALVAAAGELASALSVTGWKEGEATRAAHKCFDDWLAHRGHTGNIEDDKGVEQAKAWLLQNQYRFADWDEPKHKPADMAGFRKESIKNSRDSCLLYVFPAAWKEACRGYNATNIAKLFHQKGWLDKPAGNGYQQAPSLPGIKSKRVYLINLSALS